MDLTLNLVFPDGRTQTLNVTAAPLHARPPQPEGVELLRSKVDVLVARAGGHIGTLK